MHIKIFLNIYYLKIRNNNLIQFISTDYKFAISFAILVIVLNFQTSMEFLKEKLSMNIFDLKICFGIMGFL